MLPETLVVLVKPFFDQKVLSSPRIFRPTPRVLAETKAERERVKKRMKRKKDGFDASMISRKIEKTGAVREYSFVPQATLREREKKKTEEEAKAERRGGKRGVETLKLSSGKTWSGGSKR